MCRSGVRVWRRVMEVKMMKRDAKRATPKVTRPQGGPRPPPPRSLRDPFDARGATGGRAVIDGGCMGSVWRMRRRKPSHRPLPPIAMRWRLLVKDTNT